MNSVVVIYLLNSKKELNNLSNSNITLTVDFFFSKPFLVFSILIIELQLCTSLTLGCVWHTVLHYVVLHYFNIGVLYYVVLY